MVRTTRLKSRLAWIALAIAVAGWIGVPSDQVAHAQQPEFKGQNGDWKAYTFTRGDDVVCYMASAPSKAEGNYSARGAIYTLITNDPAKSMRNQVSVVTGYTYKVDSTVEVTIGGQTFELFTDDDRAWTQGPDDDAALVKAMVAGATMVIEGTSSRGTLTKDTYSLSGFTATKRVIDRACPS